jgi:hypothetical protein
MSVNMRPGTASMFPSPLQAAGEAGVSAGLAYDRQGEAQMREMTRMGLNPDSPRYAGLRQEWGLRKTAGVAGAKTRAANTARAASFDRLLRMIAAGRHGGAFRPQEQAVYAGRGGSSVVGGGAFTSGVREIGEADPRVRQIGTSTGSQGVLGMSPRQVRDYNARVTRSAFEPVSLPPEPVGQPHARFPLEESTGSTNSFDDLA